MNLFRGVGVVGRMAVVLLMACTIVGCSDGTSSPCPTTQLDCDGTCADLAVDARNCGACGSACDSGEACVDGACVISCPGTQIACGGACVDPLTDRAYCGASGDCAGVHLGTACEAGEACVDGACAISCPGTQIVCGGACVDPLTDRAYCGASGDCTGDHAGTTCSSAQECVAGACNSVPVVAFPSRVVVSGAGTAEVNGIYIESGTYGGQLEYEYVSGATTYTLYYDELERHWAIGTDTVAENALYYAGVLVASPVPRLGWSVLNGVDPAPIVEPQSTFDGHPYLDATVRAAYAYSDVESDLEGASEVQWYRCDTAPPATDCTAIAGANEASYVVQAADAGKYLAFEVTPVAQTGASPGLAARHEGFGPVLDWRLRYEDPVTSYAVHAVAAPDGSIYVANWTPRDGGVPSVYRFDGTVKTPLGSLSSASANDRLDLALDPVTGYPVTAFIDGTDPRLLRIAQWTGAAWSAMDYDASATVLWNVFTLALACDHAGAPIVAYMSDDGAVSPSYVARWSGGAWTQLGPEFPPDSNGNAVDVAVGPDGQPVYASYEWTRGWTIYRWDGSVWNALGPVFADTAPDRLALQVDSGNTPFVLLVSNLTLDIEVYRWDGSSWSMVGSPSHGYFGTTGGMEVSDAPLFTLSDADEFTALRWNTGTTTWDSLGPFCSGDRCRHDVAEGLDGHAYVVLQTGLILYR